MDDVDDKYLFNFFFFYLTFRGPCIVSILLLIYFQQDATLHSLFISGKLLHMFRVISSPIFRSTHNCTYLDYLVLVKPLFLPAAVVEVLGQSVVWEMYWSVLVRLQPHQSRPVQFPHHTQTRYNSSTTAPGSSNGLTITRYCKYSCVCSWWWVEIPPETGRVVFQK